MAVILCSTQSNLRKVFGLVPAEPRIQATRLQSWESSSETDHPWGIAVESSQGMTMYLWFYEWTMFDAILEGQHKRPTFNHQRIINAEQTEATLIAPHLSLKVKATPDGADLLLSASNGSGHDWPELASIIPCFNPGPIELRNPSFVDEEHKRTYFWGSERLELLQAREIHFNARLRPLLDRVSPTGSFFFSDKWPTSERNAQAGLLVRESADQQWVAAIAWEDFLSAQGHNPWKCMHLAARIGLLARGQTKTLHGKIYLFRGTKETCVEKFVKDFHFRTAP